MDVDNGWRDIPIERLRRFMQGYTERTSFRGAAERIGMSPHALQRFVEGTALPQDRTRRKVADWYLRAYREYRLYQALFEEPSSGAAPDLPIERVREAARGAAARSSLRQLALEVGLSPTGLRKFLEMETRPMDRTRRKLAEWYLRNRGE